MTISEQLACVIENIRKTRRAKQISQIDLANRANISQSFLASLESGKKQPSVLTIIKLARALEVNPGDLFPRVIQDGKKPEDIKEEIRNLLNKL
jgi:transcriptional regulator with XRE-family HTH domain